MINRNILAAGMLAMASLIGGPALADQGFDCNSPKVPERNGMCQTQVVQAEERQPFTCGNARTQDQVTYCGAVYGYEQGWCARIQDPALHRLCLRDTE